MKNFIKLFSLLMALVFVMGALAACKPAEQSTPGGEGTAAHQASLSITNSRSPPKPMSTKSVMPSNHLIICHPLFLLSSIFPSIRVFSNESVLRIR